MDDITQSLGSNALLIAATAVALTVGVLVIQRARRDLVAGPEPSDRDPLDPFRAAFEKGQMDEAEYRRIQESLGLGRPDAKGATRPKEAPPIGRPEPESAQAVPPNKIDHPEADPSRSEPGGPGVV